MDLELLGDAFIVTGTIVFVIVMVVAAIVYAIIKKKTNYDTKGVPKLVDKPEEHEGSTDNERVAAEAEMKAEVHADEAGVTGEDDKIE